MKQFEDFPDAENVNLLFVWATPDEMKLFRLEQDGLICIKEYGKINPLNSETMSCIISNLRHSFPSKETGLILWSHALGWLPNDFLSSRSFGLANGKTMSIPQLAMSLKDSFNYIIFDACYMANIEVVAYFQQKCHYLFASPIIVPTDGIIDSVSTKTLVSSLPLKERLIEVGRHYLHKYEERECKNHISISLIDLSQYSNVRKLCREIPRLEINETNLFVYKFRYIDIFFDWVTLMKSAKIDTSHINDFIVFHGNSEQEERDYGLSVFVPTSSNVDYQYAYKQTVWNTEVNWLDKFK